MPASDAVFLSASVPDEKRAPEFAKTADVVAITSAVNAVMQVILGRRRLVWGGHPAITPIVLLVAKSMKVDYGQWVHLYQTAYFKDEFPEDNAHFENVTYTGVVENDREESLLAMRKAMFSSGKFQAAVFIGGMKGIIDEFDLFSSIQPEARLVPIYSTGGATLELKGRMKRDDPALTNDLDYVGLLHAQLGISKRERRYVSPAEQPRKLEDRYRQRHKG
ncbi:MAG TPA: hypothetical protein VNX86_00520 [Rhizomicrobium sp.]|nr:hypothetical protein [Rhizomicrobium sp.]